jgi:predicted transcriptional regulator
MDQALMRDQACQALIKTLFRMCRDTRKHQQDVSDLARQIPMDYPAAKQIIALLVKQGYLETLTFGQKVALTDAGIVIAQRLIH